MIRLFRGGDGTPVAANPDDVLGTGHGVQVVAVDGDASLAAKLYARPTDALERKIRAMLANPPHVESGDADARPVLAWPVDVLRDEEGRFAGVLMPRVTSARPLAELRDPALRATSFPSADYGTVHRAASGLARTFGALHAAGYVAGSLDEADVFVSADGHVTLVGFDSVQFVDAAPGEVFAGPVDVPELSPPELHGGRDVGRRTAEQDRFTLGVLAFQLLMEGAHPFAGDYAGPGEAPSIAARVAGGMYPYLPGSPFRRPRNAPPTDALAPALRDLVSRCFDAGHRNPSARPTAEEWAAALSSAERDLVVCAANARHRHGSHLAACPWCEMARVTGRDAWAPGASTKPAAPTSDGGRRPAIAEIPGAPRRPAAPVATPKTGGTGRRPKIPASTGFGPLGETGMWLAGFGTAALLGFAADSPRVFLMLSACLVFGLALRLMDRTAGGGLALVVGALVIGVTGIAWGGRRPPTPDGNPYVVPADTAAYEIPSETEARSRLTFEPEALDSLPVLTEPRKLAEALAPLGGFRDSTLVSFVVDAAGRVDPASIRFQDPQPQYADEARLLLTASVFFKPGVRHGDRVRTRVDVPVLPGREGARAQLAKGTWNRNAQPSTPTGNAVHTRLLVSDTAFAIAPPTSSSPRIVRMAVQKQPVMLDHPRVLREMEQVYPASARHSGVQMVMVRFRLAASGAPDPRSVSATSVLRTADTTFMNHAMGIVSQARFSPARVEGRPASVWAAVYVAANP